MRRIVLFLFLLLISSVSSALNAFENKDIDGRAQRYTDELVAHRKGQTSDITALIHDRDDAFEREDWQTALKSAEAVVGAALAAPSASPAEAVSHSWFELARAWQKYAPKSEEGLWAALNASGGDTGKESPDRTEALQIAASVLIDRIDAAKVDFDFRDATIGKIAGRLDQADYDAARIALEKRQDTLPAPIRELTEMRQREEREQSVIVHNIISSIALLNSIYRDLQQSGAEPVDKDRMQSALAIDIGTLSVTGITPDATSDHAKACVNFSLPIRHEAVDFVTVVPLPTNPGEPEPAELPNRDRTVEGQDLCIFGLEHGRSYRFFVKQGLPSTGGAKLAADYDSRTAESYKDGVKIPDRATTAGFRSSAFILPKEGGGSIPLMTVNLDHVGLDLVRLSDRTLYRQIALGDIGNFVDFREYADLKQHFSDPYWFGTVNAANAPNKTVTTAIPVRALLDERARVLTSLRDKHLEQPFISDKVVTGPLTGQFRVDMLSEGMSNSPGGEPGFYAFIATIPNSSYDNFLGDQPESPFSSETDMRKLKAFGTTEGTQNSFSRGARDCDDKQTGRTVACLVSVQWFVITDIGLTYYQGPESLYVIARSLSTGKPVRDAKIELVAANNRVFDTETTDSSGMAEFRSNLTRGSDGNRLAAIVAYSGNDFSFLDYKRDSFDLSDNGVAGRRAPDTFDVYLYTDRGIYRPEESINATVLVRTTDGSAPERIPPVTLKLRTSSGSIVATRRVAPDEWRLGGMLASIQVPKTAALGAADLVAYLGDTDEQLGSSTVQLDHFRPDRARISLGDKSGWSISPPDKDGIVSIRGHADAQYLYGLTIGSGPLTDAPAADLQGELAVAFNRAPGPVAGCYDGYRFDSEEDDFTPSLERLELPKRTDEQGRLAIEASAKVPPSDVPLDAQLSLTLFDEAGKVGVQTETLSVPLDRNWLGVRPDVRLAPGKDDQMLFHADVLALSSAKKTRATKVTYRLYRERSEFLWHQDSNSWKYQPDVERVLVQEGNVQTAAGADQSGQCAAANASIDVALPLGHYYLELADDAGIKIGRHVDSGWSSADVRSPSPDKLTIHADAAPGPGQMTPVYAPGATASFSIEAPFDGEVLLSIANEKAFLWDSTVSTADRRATVKIKVDPSWAGKSFYALATVFRRNTDGTPAHGPSRALGALYFSVDLEASRFLPLDLTADEELDSNKPVTVSLKSSKAVGKGWAVVYAVDEGLLSLTGHPDPDPFHHFFGQRALGLSVFDNYGRILLSEGPGADKSGGDRSRRSLLSNYTSDTILSRYVGPIEFNDGVASVTFDEAFKFHGTVRFMAIAWTADRVGATSKASVMREALVSDIRMPRFLAPGDNVDATLNLHGVGIEDGRYRITLEPHAPLAVGSLSAADGEALQAKGDRSAELNLVYGKSRKIDLPIAVSTDAAPGYSSVDLKIEAISLDGASAGAKLPDPISKTFKVAIGGAQLPSPEVAFLKIAPGSKITLDKAKLAELTGGRYLDDKLTVKTRVGTDLESLLRNYTADFRDLKVGTLERLVWQGMVALQGPSAENGASLRETIRQVQALQGSEGFFTFYRLENETALNESEETLDRTGTGLIRVEQSSMWRSALALDFLSQAQAAGYPIAADVYHTGIDALRAEFKSALRWAVANHDRSSYSDDSSAQTATPTPVSEKDAGNRVVEDLEDPSKAKSRSEPKPVAPSENAPPAANSNSAAAGQDSSGNGSASESQAAGNDEKSGDDANARPEEVGDLYIVDNKGPEFRVCREDYLYAAMLLAENNGLDRIDLSNLQKICGGTRFRPFGAAILAATLKKFGAEAEARVVLASVDGTWGATGERGYGDDPDGRFDAMLLEFLAMAQAPDYVKSTIADRILNRQGQAKPLSVPAQVWLIRALDAFDNGHPANASDLKLDVSGSLALKNLNPHEAASDFIAQSDLAAGGVTLANRGSNTVYAALTFRGVPKADPGTSTNGFSITRRIVDDQGNDILAGGAKLKPNQILYVLLSGSRDQPSNSAVNITDPILVYDGIASGLEIIDKDIFDLARSSSGVAARALLPPEGKIGDVRMAEARDDGFMAVVRPDGTGHFQIGYTVRVSSPGQFVLPGTLVEDLRRTELSTHTASQTISIGR